MRPVERGDVPLDTNDHPRIFARYQDARADLISRMGEYCSYCEMHLDASLAIEHVKPKRWNSPDEREWSNFLLSCTNCNSTKGDHDIDLDDYYWPDRDNTALVFEYLEGGIVCPMSALSPAEQERARATIELTGLDRIPGNDPAASDRRWNNRREAWDMAVRALGHLASRDDSDMREQIVDTAQPKGFWSVWMTVFREDADMRRRFIEAFPGTAHNCFDNSCNAVNRPGGTI